MDKAYYDACFQVQKWILISMLSHMHKYMWLSELKTGIVCTSQHYEKYHFEIFNHREVYLDIGHVCLVEQHLNSYLLAIYVALSASFLLHGQPGK